jgi:RNA polymerase sigma-70 factor, ECF subfamily
VRDAIALRRLKAPRTHMIDEASAMAATATAHDALVWKRHARELKAAIEAGLRELSVRERNMLRMNLLDAMTIDDLAALFHVHRATAARQLTKARESVLDHARAQIRSKLKISDSEARSLFGDLMSQIELSLSRVLGREAERS